MLPLLEINPWTVRDRVGMGVALQILEKSLCKGRKIIKYLWFNTICQLRAAVSDVYSAASTDHESIYSLKSHRGSVIHMYVGYMESSLTEKFVKGVQRRMPEYSDHNKPVNSLVVKYILNNIEHEWVMPDTDTGRKR